MSFAFWAWITVAVVCALGECVTGGLLTLPWAIGAFAAALLEAAHVSVGLAVDRVRRGLVGPARGGSAAHRQTLSLDRERMAEGRPHRGTALLFVPGEALVRHRVWSEGAARSSPARGMAARLRGSGRGRRFSACRGGRAGPHLVRRDELLEAGDLAKHRPLRERRPQGHAQVHDRHEHEQGDSGREAGLLRNCQNAMANDDVGEHQQRDADRAGEGADLLELPGPPGKPPGGRPWKPPCGMPWGT